MNISAILPTFVVTLREGFEAALVVGIVMACLQKAQQTRLYPWVYGGIFGGVITSLLVGILLGGILQQLSVSDQPYAPVIQEFLEASFGLLAIALLSWMLIWMTQQAKTLKAEVEGAVTQALQGEGAGWAVFSLILIAVLREGFETVLFIVAKFQSGFTTPTLGAVSGLLSATLLGYLLFQLGVKINIRLFFQVMGVFLLLIVGGLVVGALKHINGGVDLLTALNPQYAALCWGETTCLLGGLVWDTSSILPDKAFPGIVLKALFGYRDHLYAMQAIAYLAFLSLVGGRYFQSLRPSPPKVSSP
ncbi:FTR1 family protein [Spirulina subsalsa FACHB-351]|uniref:FTR1 family protein n=1 Tax=Spirulina subsalsa FACHB-351 TaxID=234711 RepID=A0ABT3L251_9CYAN|nr:FTR1 family protein [Spirulina subsalsa]MCW6035558.1 FTR1 family protein [Spirulina subsalsa FACHB-351]